MRLATILNRVEKHKSFVYESGRFEGSESCPTLVIPIRPRDNGRR